MTRFGVSIGLVCALGARDARALEAAPGPTSVVRIDYAAPPSCPSRERFVTDVLRRTPGVRLANDAELARGFDVVVESTPAESRARLQFVDVDGQLVSRELAAESCSEVVDGIAVVTALAIDPRLFEVGDAGESEAIREPPPVAAEARAEAPPTAGPVAQPVALTSRPVPERPKPPPVRERGGSFRLGAAVSDVTDIAPKWSPGGVLFSDYGPSSDVRARLSFGYSGSGRLMVDNAVTRFWLLAGRAELCPVAWWPLPTLALRPCAGGELGAHHAEGEESPRLAEPMGSTAAWLAAAISVRAELDLGDALLIELTGQVRVPVLRQTFVFQRPTATIYETPPIGAGAQLGVAFDLVE